MKLSLSTNWCNRRITDGEEISALASELGFDELELGFHTTKEQVEGIRKHLDKIPVGSVHAFCPVPISAPCGYPELYQLASFSKAQRELAAVHIKQNIAFAHDIGADTLVLHAGRVGFSGLFEVSDSSTLRDTLAAAKNDISDIRYMKKLASARVRRMARGKKMLEIFASELEKIVESLEKSSVTLALENLPYLEGFPNEEETLALLKRMKDFPIKAWFDTGHDRVRYMHGWAGHSLTELERNAANYQGMHLNDVVDYYDDHLAPGFGKVDFLELKPFASKLKHVVFEPKGNVSAEDLSKGVDFIRKAWGI